MITSQSTTEIEVSVGYADTQFITLTCASAFILSNLWVDDGESPGEYRPLKPLFLWFDGAERTLPLEIAAGMHSIELRGERFRGVGLLLLGMGLHAVTVVSIGGAESELAVQVAAIPSVKSASRDPVSTDLTGILGTQWLNTLTGFWFREIQGAWQQQP